MIATVNIFLKQGVLDAQGKTVYNALKSLHFDTIQDVKIGKRIIIDLDTNDHAQAKEDVIKMCEELLANTVIEDYEIEKIK